MGNSGFSSPTRSDGSVEIEDGIKDAVDGQHTPLSLRGKGIPPCPTAVSIQAFISIDS
ncbi:hypothetical protein JAAARDRAFT_41330 [Jaapia argillacea MUCL 33604]|uniref:Uncharacterized protein n=1 Tax=Jaapia argillacea MUCL 33604 TaxID=933084 RepID=A0A067P902_9AGAM|nr:hypothetical protein JAAARDRAFT_41330 [Jaapia argillacea MUCL 33604]